MAAQESPLLGYPTNVLIRADVAEGTTAFHFEKPQRFEFRLGQSCDVTSFVSPEIDSEGNAVSIRISE